MFTKEEIKQYESPCIETIILENESVLCMSGGTEDLEDGGPIFPIG